MTDDLALKAAMEAKNREIAAMLEKIERDGRIIRSQKAEIERLQTENHAMKLILEQVEKKLTSVD